MSVFLTLVCFFYNFFFFAIIFFDILIYLCYNKAMMNKADQQDYLIDFQFIEQPKLINDIRLYQIGKKFCNKNTYIPPHLHINWFELTVILGGKGKIYTNGKTEYVEVSEGDIYLSFPADIHEIESDSEIPLKYSFLSFILNGSSFASQFKKITMDFYEPKQRVFRDRNVSLLLDLLLSEFMSVAYKQKDMMVYLFNEILIFTCRNFLYQSQNVLPLNVSKKEMLCYSIMRYIDANILLIKDFSDIANHFNYNYSYLSKVFKQTTNITILDYLSTKKLERAKILLDERKLSLTKIAETLNYASIYSFSKSFKYRFGISPTEYQKRYGKNELPTP